MTTALLLALVLSVPGQSSVSDNKSACEQRAQIVMRSLEPDNALRQALESGERGDCVHQLWMDTMHRFGIKQASFRVEYSWERNKVTFNIKRVTYLTTYYSQYDRAI